MRIIKVISGGQTGGDMGGLLAARNCGVETGGTAPYGWRDETGSNPLLESFGLVQHPSRHYLPRTEYNVMDSHITVIFGRYSSRGCQDTIGFCQTYGRPFVTAYWNFSDELPPTIHHQLASTVYPALLKFDEDIIVNVAGNRESTNPGIEAVTRRTMELVIQRVNS